ncbi:hypothetical protein MXD62_22545 [Frankia sp. Mgl5]|uniref:Uncharacterized protein n=1 Tax=Parafrankia soli TaxID=2599596 RepID=A0A1S1R1E4_9ACTN|nr:MULTISPECIES: hypothetical protein [Frankiaceae]ABW10758.1 conserved hypothetical protein [Frankia sp. EAN1pec]CAI7974533.1 conserved hypothetical protein [Frankia sp. Hr75.2]MCK9929910.1 hypothetical protein [Frankia sp. Mgl5]OHV38534.1 hypothetical protein BBK14_13875 [Parafrankia soli]TCJ33228.1 hypothetical protein E0504_38920 [Parafrankia sp. BMG5.11]
MQVTDPIERAGLADELMWTSHPQRSALRAIRAAAIRQALEGGYAPTDLASRMKVTVADVGWMADHPVSVLPAAPRMAERATRIA